MMTAVRSVRALLLAVASVAMAGTGLALAAETVLIPSRIIYPGEIVEAAALQQVTLLEGKIAPSSMAVSIADLEGKIAKRTLLPGRYVPVNALREAYLVEKGAAVELVYVAGQLEISASAVTLQPGSPGDQVKVRNIDSGKILSGVVMADGSIRVSGT